LLLIRNLLAIWDGGIPQKKDQGMEILAARGRHMLVVGTPLEWTSERTLLLLRRWWN
jgi:hypothetical protein